MIVAIIVAIVIVVVIPVGFLMSTSVAAAVFGFLLKTRAEAEGNSELVEANY